MLELINFRRDIIISEKKSWIGLNYYYKNLVTKHFKKERYYTVYST
jgi:hypothetical protein